MILELIFMGVVFKFLMYAASKARGNFAFFFRIISMPQDILQDRLDDKIKPARTMIPMLLVTVLAVGGLFGLSLQFEAAAVQTAIESIPIVEFFAGIAAVLGESGGVDTGKMAVAGINGLITAILGGVITSFLIGEKNTARKYGFFLGNAALSILISMGLGEVLNLLRLEKLVNSWMGAAFVPLMMFVIFVVTYFSITFMFTYMENYLVMGVLLGAGFLLVNTKFMDHLLNEVLFPGATEADVAAFMQSVINLPGWVKSLAILAVMSLAYLLSTFVSSLASRLFTSTMKTSAFSEKRMDDPFAGKRRPIGRIVLYSALLVLCLLFTVVFSVGFSIAGMSYANPYLYHEMGILIGFILLRLIILIWGPI